jgi:transcriptional regulator with XRE-family HTH domain
MKKNNLSGFLKKTRIERGLSQEQVSRYLGYSTPQFISNWERGVSNPPLDKLAAIMDLYRISRQNLVRLILMDTRREIESHFTTVKPSKRRKVAG